MNHFRWIFCLGLVVLIIYGGVKEYKRSPRVAGGLVIPEKAELKISGRVLDEAETAELRSLFANLWVSEKQLHTNPDIRIKAQIDGMEGPGFYSVWLEKGFVLDGYFSGASGGGLQIYQRRFRLNRKTEKFLRQFEYD